MNTFLSVCPKKSRPTPVKSWNWVCAIFAALYAGFSSKIVRVLFSPLTPELYYLIMEWMKAVVGGSPVALLVEFKNPHLPVQDVKLFYQFFKLCGNAKHINGALTKYSYSYSAGCCHCFRVSCTRSGAVIISCVISVNVVYL